jgi:hypothetical protein
MRRTWLVIVLAVGLCPLLSAAVVRDHFLARTTQDLVDVCSTGESDPLHAAAIGFCQGFLLGAYHSMFKFLAPQQAVGIVSA